MKMQAEERLEKTHLAASAPIAVSRVICRYSVVSNAMIRKEKVSINLGFPFEMLECSHSELQRPGLILLIPVACLSSIILSPRYLLKALS